ncbi:MAG: rhodanese-related sulfurtransferase [Alphaproteobacteria bacterium]
MTQNTVFAFYHFTPLPDFEHLQEPLKALMLREKIRGSILLASEGVNGTVAGPDAGIKALIAHFHAIPELAGLEGKYSYAEDQPFGRAKVRLKKEIVAMGVEGIDPLQSVGTYIEPEDWNALIEDPDTVLVDTRNDYEFAIGTFKGAIDPETTAFRDFPEWAEQNLAEAKGKKIAMFCTGGIRCEKATALVKSLGHDQVFHLKGGILNYLEKVPKVQSLWEGECFVFDDRVSIDHDLQPGHHDLCHACRRAITEEDKTLDSYTPGVSCKYCISEKTDEQRARFAERQRQIALARARGEEHLGQD